MSTDHADPAYTAYSTHTADAVDWYARDYPGNYDERTTAKLLGLPVATLARWREWNPALVPPHTEDAMGDTAYPRAAVLRWLASLPKVHGVPQFPAMHGRAHRVPNTQAMH